MTPTAFRRIPLLLAALAIAACAAPEPKAPNVNLSGYPPAFKDGYVDGCASARSAFSTRKDEQRFRSDSQYAQGWRDGHDICGRR